MHSLLSLIVGVPLTTEAATLVVLAGDLVALVTVPSVLLQRSGRPMAALSWVLALLALPYLGVLAWWGLGRTHLARRRRARIRARERLCEPCPPSSRRPLEGGAALRSALPFGGDGQRWTEGVFPPAGLTRARVRWDGDEIFSGMQAAVESARSEVRALFYIWRTDTTGRQLAETLACAALRGVRVRILVDAIGASQFLRRCGDALRRDGVEVAGFLPSRFRPWAPTFNFRNHRKLLIADERVAFVGGMNVGDEYARNWHDLACELEGDAVHALEHVFEEDWYFATGQDSTPRARRDVATNGVGTCTVIASGPDRVENRVHDAFFLGMSQARDRIWLATPYFVPSVAVLASLRCAAQRGLDVRVVVPSRNDIPVVGWAARSYYPELLRAGIRVFEYQPRFAHTKAIVLDDDLTMVGSPNTDIRSFRLNFELACFIESASVNRDVSRVLESDMSESVELALADVERRPTSRRLLESAAHLLSPLL